MDIPEDVMTAARHAAGDTQGWITSAAGHEVIARAILAERKRCADVCFELGDNKHDRYSYEAHCGWKILGETPQWEDWEDDE